MDEEQEFTEPGESKAAIWKRRILKVFGAVFAVIFLALAGFFAGIYLRILDVHEINEKIDLYAMPMIGEIFVKPFEKKEEPEEQPTETADQDEKKPEEKKKDEKKDEKKEEKKEEKKDELKPGESKPIVLTAEEIEKRQKEEEAAEKKRVSKLARLYNSMKPKAAAEVMADLDDDVAIAILQKMDEAQAANVLAAFDPAQSARLTRSMYTGRRSAMSSPGDQMEPARRAPQAAEE